ncbi:unnamed protein product [Linum trigynum]|uniref:Uncharacterized protein n=1 Tax=Linum trigynum TaxID=586398 RepID=A0AAV2DPK8_9ROSI
MSEIGRLHLVQRRHWSECRHQLWDLRPKADVGPRLNADVGPRPNADVGPRPNADVGPRPNSDVGQRISLGRLRDDDAWKADEDGGGIITG